MKLDYIDFIYLGLILSGFIATIVFTVFCKAIAGRIGITDNPMAHNEEHKGHKKPIPLLGGAAMFAGLATVSAMVIILAVLHQKFNFDFLRELPDIEGFLKSHLRFFWVITGGLLALILGLIDDLKGMKAWKKFLGQFIIAIIAVIGGGIEISLFIDNEIITAAISIFWLMLLMNSINFLDNMDGLAVGVSCIAFGFFGIIAGLCGQYLVAGFSFLLTGVTLGFWIFNHNPASIFMGDSGSHVLGYFLGIVSASVTYFHFSSSLTKFPILIPLFILAIPLFDAMMVVLIRTKNRKVFWKGDHNHISHRFVKMGLNRKYSVMMVHFLSLIIGLSSFVVIWGDFKIAVIAVIQILLLLLMISIIQLTLGDTDSNISDRD